LSEDGVSEGRVSEDRAREDVGQDDALVIRLQPLASPAQRRRLAGPPLVACDEATLFAILAETRLAARNEAGGLLLGRVTDLERAPRVEIVAQIPAEAVEASPAHLTFTHESWRRLRDRRLAERPDLDAVGWYHSHPRLGIFFSLTDCDLHRQVFHDTPWAVALVVEPFSEAYGWFSLVDGEVRDCPEVLASTSDQPPARSSPVDQEGPNDGVPLDHH
jgi:proteasome lid subunit RPN8/RPN11